jgi:hypothetical protein
MNRFRTACGLSVLAASLALLSPAAANATSPAGPPGVNHDQIVEAGGEGINLNICGDLAAFDFHVTTRYTLVVWLAEDVVHNEAVSVGTYTVTFLDASLGVWKGTIREVWNYQLTAGGTFANTIVFNSFEGPVRIHETLTYVLGPDGTIRVDRYTTDVVGCP